MHMHLSQIYVINTQSSQAAAFVYNLTVLLVFQVNYKSFVPKNDCSICHLFDSSKNVQKTTLFQSK